MGANRHLFLLYLLTILIYLRRLMAQICNKIRNRIKVTTKRAIEQLYNLKRPKLLKYRHHKMERAVANNTRQLNYHQVCVRMVPEDGRPQSNPTTLRRQPSPRAQTNPGAPCTSCPQRATGPNRTIKTNLWSANSSANFDQTQRGAGRQQINLRNPLASSPLTPSSNYLSLVPPMADL